MGWMDGWMKLRRDIVSNIAGDEGAQNGVLAVPSLTVPINRLSCHQDSSTRYSIYIYMYSSKALENGPLIF